MNRPSPGWSITQVGDHWLWSAWGDGVTYNGTYRDRELAEARAQALYRRLTQNFKSSDTPTAAPTPSPDTPSGPGPTGRTLE